MEYVAIDFETANEKRGSPCSLGVVVVKGQEIVEQKYWLIRPRELRFAPPNVQVHGITEKDVADRPEFNELWPTIESYLSGQIVLAHYAQFDMSVLRHSLDSYELPYPSIEYSCTWKIAKATWPRCPSYRLPFLAKKLGIDFEHHHALEDAAACSKVVQAACQELGTTTFEELEEATQLRRGKLYPQSYMPPTRTDVQSETRRSAGGKIDYKSLRPETTSFDEKHPFFGKTVIFTGTLQSMRREDAAQLVANCGGLCKSSVSQKTNIVVLGDLDYRTFAAGKHMSGKLERAEALASQGHDIEIIAEVDFLRMIVE